MSVPMQALMIFLAIIAATLATASTLSADSNAGVTVLLFMAMFTFGVSVGVAARGRV